MSELGASRDDWSIVEFGKVAVRRTGGWQPGGASVPYVGLEHIRPYELELLECGSSDDVNSGKTFFREGDILYGKLRPYFRKCVRAPYDGVCSTDIWVVIPKDSSLTDSGFLYWVVADSAFSDFANQGETGTRMPRANWDYVSRYEVALPPISEQRRISKLLDAFASMIEQKRRQVEIIDQLIEVEGSLALDSSVETSEVPLSEIASFTNGYSYKSEELVERSQKGLVNLKNFGRRGGFRLDGLKPFDGSPKPSQLLHEGDVLVAKTDLTQDAEVVGRCVRMPRLPRFDTYVASLDVAIVRPKATVSKETLLALLSQTEFRDHCLGYANGTTVLHLSKEALPAYVVTLPDAERTSRLTATVSALAAQQDSSLESMQRLIQTRDTLLPLLLSGELTITQVEQGMEEVS